MDDSRGHSLSSVVDYTFTSEDRLLLDANVWLLVYGPQKPGGRDSRVPIYSSALKRILSAGSSIFIDILIVSELINGIIRIRNNLGRQSSLRDFRGSPAFVAVAEETAEIARRVVGHCTRMDDPFAQLAIDAVLDEYSLGKSDFNDQILRELCMNEGLTLVTDDSGFGNADIPVLSGNARLLHGSETIS